ncbi:MAG: hypothetical protein IPM57_02205 [Oligoflexia bacterium]|nr:hypothetical protein [Oligoflexia bacterium]
MRDEIKFKDVNELVEQIQRDVNTAREHVW